MTDIPFFLAAVAIVIIILVARWLKSRPGFRRRFPGRAMGVDVNRDLLSACRGDKAMAQRLIQHELDRKPDLSHTAAALMALSRLRSDKR